MELASLFVRIGADMRDLQNSLTQAERQVVQFGRRMERIGGTLTRALTLPLAAFGAHSLKVAADFEGSMNRVQALSGATGDALEAMEAQAKELGATTQYTASQAADAMGFLAMAGFEAEQIMGAMPSTLQLAAAAQMDLSRAADITSNILTGFGLEVDELARANDVLVTTFTSSNTSLEQLGEAMKYVGPVAQSAGVAFEEVAAAVGLLGNAGIQGSMAGTSLRGALSRLVKPTGAVASELDRLGVQTLDAEGRLLSLTEIIEQLEPHAEDTGAMMTIFGQRAGPAMAALASQGSAALRELREELEQSGGTAQRIADTQMRGLRGAVLELRSAFEGLQLELTKSGGALDALTGMVRKLADVLRGLNEVDAETAKWVISIGVTVAAIGPLLLILGKLTAGVVGLATALSVSLLPLIAVGGPVLIGLGALSAAFVKAKLDAAAAAEGVKRAADQMRESIGEMTGSQAADRFREVDEQLRRVRELEQRQRELRAELSSIPIGSQERGAAVRELNQIADALRTMPSGDDLREEWRQLVRQMSDARSTAVQIGNAVEDEVVESFDNAADSVDTLIDKMRELDQIIRYTPREISIRDPEIASERDRRPEPAGALSLTPVEAHGERPGREIRDRGVGMQFLDGLQDQVMGLITSFGPLAAAAAALKPVFDGLIDALSPVLSTLAEPLRIIGQLIATQITPLLKLLAPPLRLLATVSSYVVESLGVLVRSIGKAVNALPFVSARGVIAAGQDMIDSARRQRDALNNTGEDVDDFGDAVREATDALTNVPRVLSLEWLRWRASGAGGGVTAPGGGGLTPRNPIDTAPRHPVEGYPQFEVRVHLDGREITSSVESHVVRNQWRGGTSRLATSF